MVLNKEEYITKIKEQLDNPLHYEKLQQDPTINHLDKIKTWTSKWLRRGQITKDIVEWVINEQARPGVAFGNVKTHKPNNPVRLITSCCGTAIENFSQLSQSFI